MKLFLKHILRSIKRRPIQPIILLLTLSISVAVSASILSVRTALFEERDLTFSAGYESADITVTLNGSSDSRFMFAEDARQLLGDGCAVSGYYEILLTHGDNEIVSAAAVDFETIGDIFTLEFTDYEDITENNKGYSALISPSFASKLGLSSEDEFEAEFLGTGKSYRVAGVASRGFFGKFDVLLDISGITKILASRYSFAAALGDDFRPCNTILIDLPDGESTAEAIKLLAGDEIFKSTTISDVSTKLHGKVNDSMLFAVVNFAIVLCCIMACVVSYSCFSILSAERIGENYSFKAAGASRSVLWLMQYGEAFIYFLASSVLGLLISLPLIRISDGILGFSYTEMRLTFKVAALSILFLLLSIFLSVTAFMLLGKKEAPKRRGGGMLLYLLTASVPLYILTMLLPITPRLPVGMIAMVVLIFFIYTLGGVLFTAFTKAVCKRRDSALLKCGKCDSTTLHYALKSTHSVSILHSVVRMISLLTTAVLCIGYLSRSIQGNLVNIKNIFNAEYTVVGANERCYQRLTECESVASVDKMYFTLANYEGGISTRMISTSDIGAIDDSLKITRQPSGNEALISKNEANALGLNVGDTFKITQNNVELELYLVDTINSAEPFILFDCEHFGIDYAMLLLNPKAELGNELMLKEISAVTAEEVASVATTDSLFDMLLSSMSLYLKCVKFLVAFVLIFSVIGIFDTFLECYKSRRTEFEMYRTAGMSQSQVRKMKLAEISLCSGFALLIGVIGFFIMLPVLNKTMLSVFYDAAGNFKAFFKG